MDTLRAFTISVDGNSEMISLQGESVTYVDVAKAINDQSVYAEGKVIDEMNDCEGLKLVYPTKENPSFLPRGLRGGLLELYGSGFGRLRYLVRLPALYPYVMIKPIMTGSSIIGKSIYRPNRTYDGRGRWFRKKNVKFSRRLRKPVMRGLERDLVNKIPVSISFRWKKNQNHFQRLRSNF